MKKTTTYIIFARILVIMLAILTLLPTVGFGQDLKKVLDLKGSWKFSIGDDANWAKHDYDDSHWEDIYVPKSWEEQGFHGYDGFAWYRKEIQIDKLPKERSYYLDLGFIDDVDQVFVNGYKIGQTGHFPPNYSTAYNAHRLYIFPHKAFHMNTIVIAVRVYDEGGEGGITHGKVGIWVDNEAIFTDYDLQGEWSFKTGYCNDLEEVAANHQKWDEILVPGTWEDQGYKNYDGVACYAKEFELDGQFENDRMVLIMGRIDDLDMVFVNGTLIGQSSDFDVSTAEQRSDMFKQIRGYYIPENVLNHHGKNLIVVRVLDWFGQGGIWDGSIGLITQNNYIDYWRKKRNSMK